MSDLISRQALHERINETVNEGLIFSGMTIAEFIEALIDSMPSAERVGKWVPSHIPESILCECDQCGFDCGAYSFSYCPHCGARMKGEEE